jgi:hypothetical protein
MFEGGGLLGRFAWKVTENPEKGADPGECRTASLLDGVEPDAELTTGMDPHPPQYNSELLQSHGYLRWGLTWVLLREAHDQRLDVGGETPGRPFGAFG